MLPQSRQVMRLRSIPVDVVRSVWIKHAVWFAFRTMETQTMLRLSSLCGSIERHSAQRNDHSGPLRRDSSRCYGKDSSHDRAWRPGTSKLMKTLASILWKYV